MTGPRISRREIEDEEAATVVAEDEETAELEDSAKLEEELDTARLSSAFRKESAEPEESDGASESAVTAEASRESAETAGALSKESAAGISCELDRATSAELDELKIPMDELDKTSPDEPGRLEELLSKTLELDASELLETAERETFSASDEDETARTLELTGKASDELETVADDSAAFVSSSNSANRSRTCEDAAADIKKKHRQKTRNRMGKIYKIRKDKRRRPPYFTFDMLCSRMPPYSTGETWW